MTDNLKEWMLSVGASRKDCHLIQDRMSFLCNYFNINNPGLPKRIVKSMLRSFTDHINDGGIVTRDKFITSSLLALEPKLKWDLDHIAFCRSRKFYQSSKWKNLRIKALAGNGCCAACGASPKNKQGTVLHVDHILPRSIYPEYALNIRNLQILCADCNIGKGNTLEKDFR